ncbi:MAG: hypothetical protein V7785_22825 [Bermanella sp.]
MSMKTKLSGLARYTMGFLIGASLVATWSATEMDLQMRYAQWDKEVQAMTLFKHRVEFNKLSTVSEISGLTDSYLIEQLLDFENPVISYCQKELTFSFLLPSCSNI